MRKILTKPRKSPWSVPMAAFKSAFRISHFLGCTFAATLSRSPFKEMNPVASDWL
jgi:hypothetical protein